MTDDVRSESSVDPAAGVGGSAQQRYRPGPVELLIVVVAVLLLGRGQIESWFTSPALRAGATIFVSIVVQATPFLVLGVVISGLITAFVPASFFERALPRRPALAVPVAGVSGVALPGCECASVPIAGTLIGRGMTPAAALAFLLSSPAINPVVIVSTYIAFPRDHVMALARFVASLLTAVVVGWLWLRFGKSDWLRVPARHRHDGESKLHTFRTTTVTDFLQAGGFLVLGAFAAAVLNVAMPTAWLDTLAANPWLAILALALLAVVLSICSEADAFVAASLTQFPLTARLVFLVVGPVVDVKLISLQAGTFGARFASRFAPLTFVVAVLTATAVGTVLL